MITIHNGQLLKWQLNDATDITLHTEYSTGQIIITVIYSLSDSVE